MDPLRDESNAQVVMKVPVQCKMCTLTWCWTDGQNALLSHQINVIWISNIAV